MATQSLYRRYRPQRFSELRGQEHVVRALRNAVVQGKEGQAYLFSGPRGTGKTTSARILAKVLNCENPIDGEPCCECVSCIAVQHGTSFDVHELDAASNNGVDAMRDLIERTKLGTPGRHKVYILDEVHMLSKGAEAALLKTLEEPPPHVVFVLATTDPQKVSETIRSRTQHLQFHLLSMDVLDTYIRWLADDAGLSITDDAIDAVLRRGGGSARDTISALELIAASGGEAPDETPLDQFIQALIESDPGAALTAVASSMRMGRDARTLAEALIGHLRECFLSLMAPELVALPDARAREVGELARQLGAAGAVRGIETLGAMLVEMRHAPDARVLLEVALVKLASPATDGATAGLIARIDKLERLVAGGVIGSADTSAAASAGRRVHEREVTTERPSRTESVAARPTTTAPGERATIGSRIRATEPEPSTTPRHEPTHDQVQPDSAQPTPATASDAREPSAVSDQPMSGVIDADPAISETGDISDTGDTGDISDTGDTGDTAPGSTPASNETPLVDTLPIEAASATLSGEEPAERPATSDDATEAWVAAVDSLKPIAKARFSQATLVGLSGDTLSVTFPSEGLRLRGEDARPEIEAALGARLGRRIALRVSVDPEAADPSVGDRNTVARPSDHPDDSVAGPAPTGRSDAPATQVSAPREPRPARPARPTEPQSNDEHAGIADTYELPQADGDVDLGDLRDAPPSDHISPVERLAAHFPGSQLIEEER